MTREYDISIQPGHIARHTPRNAGAQGREAAVVDVAQDLLLRSLHDEGLLDGVAIKGGTAIRKLYAGNEENVSEKIARLNRTTTARDMYDLAWICSQGRLWSELDKGLIRRLTVLKVWTDSNGMHAGGASWDPAHAKSSFDPERWLRPRGEKEFDMEDIGALAVPTPRPEELSERVSAGFAFLAELDAQEEQLAQSDPRDRGLAIRLLESLPGGRLAGGILY